MLSKEEFDQWCWQLGLSDQAKGVITRIRTSNPSRRVQSSASVSEPQSITEDEASFSEFRILAHEIAGFPRKQRQALLTDLAARMAFSKGSSALQDAFLAEGIRLEEYRQPLTESERERSRNASLLAQAHKRLRSLKRVHSARTEMPFG